jgi:hypothetical protein
MALEPLAHCFHILQQITICSTRFTIPGLRSKEGDVAFVPTTRHQLRDWPSMVLEVGIFCNKLQFERL